MSNPTLRDNCIRLRVRERLSYGEIRKLTGASKGSLSFWLRGYPLTKEELQRREVLRATGTYPLRVSAIAKAVSRRRSKWVTEADRFWDLNKSDSLFTLGVGLYWGEGSKRGHSLSLCNCDPRLLLVWIHWCKKFIPEVDLRFQLQVYPEINRVLAESYWRGELGFTEKLHVYNVKPPVSSKRKRAKKSPLPYGVMKVSVRKGSAEWHHKMLHIIELVGSI